MNKQIEELYHKLDAQDKIINEQVLEIARLKEKENKYNDLCKKKIGDMSYEELFVFTNGLLDEIWNLEEKIDKATEWVHKHISKYNCKGITIIDWDELSNPNDLLEILGEKENEGICK